MSFKTARAFAAAALLSLAAACTSTSQVTSIQSASETVISSEVVALNVVRPSTVEGGVVAGAVRDQLFGKLVSRGKFAAVKPADDVDAAYSMEVLISDVEQVSVGARLFLGVLAGGDELTALVTLTERATGKVLKKFQVETEAAAHWLSSDYGIDSAVTKLTNEIVDRL